MTSLLEQKESLLRLQKDTAKQIERINRELIYENKQIDNQLSLVHRFDKAMIFQCLQI